MSENRDKPADSDPDATVTGLRGLPAAKPDDDATVTMPSRKALENPDSKPDDDATVMMTRDALKAPDKTPDPDSTVMMTRDVLKEPDGDSTVMMPPGGFKPDAEAPAAAPPAAFRTDSDPDIAASGTQTPPSILTQEPSRMPMIAGGIVVVLVILYFAVMGGKGSAPEAQKPEPVASAPAPAAPAAPVAPAPAAAAPAPAATAPAAAAATAAAMPASPGPSKVKEQLAPEIKRGLVAVTEEGGGATITLRSDHQFASGGVDPEAKLRPLLQSIAAALDKVPGSIVITGHADATPSSNPKFPSNQALSVARADSAAKIMAAKLSDPKRITGEGASDSQPLAPSDTAGNRAKNRRVTIVVKP